MSDTQGMPHLSPLIVLTTAMFSPLVPLTPDYRSSEERVSLLLRAPTGTTYHYELKATTTLGDMSAKLTMRMDMKVLSIDGKGMRVFENKAHEGKFVQGASTMDVPTTITQSVVKPNGVLVSSEPETAAPSQARSRRMMQIVVSEKPLAIGSSWSWKEPASELNAKVPAKGFGTLKSVGKKNGIDCANVTITITEEMGDKPMQSKMDAWISLADGMLITNNVTITNFAASPTQVGTLQMVVNRIKK